jgi:hypothetical protein
MTTTAPFLESVSGNCPRGPSAGDLGSTVLSGLAHALEQTALLVLGALGLCIALHAGQARALEQISAPSRTATYCWYSGEDHPAPGFSGYMTYLWSGPFYALHKELLTPSPCLFIVSTPGSDAGVPQSKLDAQGRCAREHPGYTITNSYANVYSVAAQHVCSQYLGSVPSYTYNYTALPLCPDTFDYGVFAEKCG